MDSTNHESTLRDTLAAAAVTGLLAGSEFGIPTNNSHLFLEVLAMNSYRVADAMLAERAKAKKPPQHAFPRGNGR